MNIIECMDRKKITLGEICIVFIGEQKLPKRGKARMTSIGRTW